MGRSVGTDPEAIGTIHFTLNTDEVLDDDLPDYVRDEIEYLERLLCENFPELEPEDEWLSREGRIIASSHYCRITLYEYFDLFSLNIAPEWYDYGDEGEAAEAEELCYLMFPRIQELMDENFDTYDLYGRFSNGEAIYSKRNAE